jgi:hypothetical protein
MKGMLSDARSRDPEERREQHHRRRHRVPQPPAALEDRETDATFSTEATRATTMSRR